MPERDQALASDRIQSADAVDGAWWDGLVASSPDATVFQSSAWAAYVHSLGQDPWFLWSTDGAGQPRALLLVQRTRPARGEGIRRLLGRGGTSWAWRHGPLVTRDTPAQTVDALTQYTERQAGQRRARIERATSPLHHGREAVETALVARGWSPTRQATILLDLRAPEETLWRALKPAARKALAKCDRDGVKVRRLLADEPLETYLELLRETRQRLGFGLPPYYPSETMRRAFRGTGAVSEVFVAERDACMLGGLGIIGFGPAVIEIAAAQSRVALVEKLYTNDAIKWAVIRWAREAGFRWYDLGGIDPDPSDQKAMAIRQFKEKWGGAVVEFAAFSWRP